MKLSYNAQKRLGVLWVLLNISTEYKSDPGVICGIMDDIKARCPSADKMWADHFQIKYRKKVILDY